MTTTHPQRHLRSAIPNKKPTSLELNIGQIAINYHDECIYIKNDLGQIIQIANSESVVRALKSVQIINGKAPNAQGVILLEPKDIGPYGVPTLTSNGKVDPDYLNSYLYSIGEWNPGTNQPPLPAASEYPGGFLTVSTTGTYGGVEYLKDSWVVSDGATWQQRTTGSVSSVSLSINDTLYTVEGSPITTSGTITIVLEQQEPGTFFAGPTNDIMEKKTPEWRRLESADLPIIDEGKY